MPLLLIISILVIAILGLVDGSAASLVLSSLIFAICYLCTIRQSNEKQIEARNTILIVISGYLVFSYIASLSFDKESYFLLSDPSNYIARNISKHRFEIDLKYLYDCYFGLSDSNALYNTYLSNMCVLANKFMGGATVYFMTLCQTAFGVFSMLVMYDILSDRYSPATARNYTLLFAFLTIFLFYSSVIVRDVIIAFLYMVAIRILFQKFNPLKIIVLVALMILAWGVRLYSGIFMLSFIFLYIYLGFKQSSYKIFLVPLFCVIAYAFFVKITNTSILSLTNDELDLYTEMTVANEMESGGLIGRLYNLPAGLKQLALLFYSQMSPFPPFMTLTGVKTFSNLSLSLGYILPEMFWFLVFYSILYIIFVYRGYRYLTMRDWLMWALALVFIIANTAHPDFRRMMPVYPITYVVFIKLWNSLGAPRMHKTMISRLSFAYFSLLIVYYMIK